LIKVAVAFFDSPTRVSVRLSLRYSTRLLSLLPFRFSLVLLTCLNHVTLIFSIFSLITMDPYKYERTSAASAADAGSDAGVDASGSVHDSHVAPVQQDVSAGVLSGIGPNAEEAGQVARDKGWTDPVPFDYSDFNSKERGDWAGVAARYEWKDEYGDVGPAIPELEDQLFRSEEIPRAGIKLDE
jgi:hypothetical protein